MVANASDGMLLHQFADINECNGDSGCDMNAVCRNTLGSYTCTCHGGYIGDEFTCRGMQLQINRSYSYSEKPASPITAILLTCIIRSHLSNIAINRNKPV